MKSSSYAVNNITPDAAPVCDLCGLRLPAGTVSLSTSDGDLRFCCMGCRMVYSMLMEATDSPDPSRFRETDLYKKCLAAGIIPASHQELEAINPGAIKSLPNDLGTDPQPATDTPRQWLLPLNLKLSGMWCPACAWVIEATVGRITGVSTIACIFATDRMQCRYDPVKTTPEEITTAVRKLGYEVSTETDDAGLASRRSQFIRFMISAFFTANIMMLSFALYSGFFTRLESTGIRNISIPIFLMAAIVFFFGGLPIHRKAWSSLSSGAPGMETLVSMGAASAFLYSIFNFISGSIHLYFDTASMLIVLVLLGKIIERRARDGIQKDLDAFFTLKPKKARICSDRFPDGRFTDAWQLRPGDVFRVDPEESVPADGTILSGVGTVDESAITGESRAIGMKPGLMIKSGTTIVQGSFKVKADKVGADALLGQMIETMQQALGQKAAFEGKTDRLLRWFVPLVALFAISTGIGCYLAGHDAGEAMLRAVTVMVISCPCALGIAIPMARVAGVSAAATRGIMVGNFKGFELARRARIFVFDKTGTLTTGRWSLVKMAVSPDWTEKKILSMASSLEKNADHYIAVEILNHAEKMEIPPTGFDRVSQHENGVSGNIGKMEVKIGSSAFVSWYSLDHEKMNIPGAMNSESLSRVYMTIDNKPAAVLFFGDRIKPESGTAVRMLLSQGHHLVMVSGDESETTRQVGTELGITETRGDMLPADKATLVSALRGPDRMVAMIGDGINDAPALATADVSMAIYSGYQLGKSTSDVTFMRGDPGQIPEFTALSERVEKKIQQNLWFSFIYNIIAIPLAMAGLLSPVVAVIAMLLSSLSVTVNTLLFSVKERQRLRDG